jgi:phage shock protein PspC (stress-responsive transcriptional regulator)
VSIAVVPGVVAWLVAWWISPSGGLSEVGEARGLAGLGLRVERDCAGLEDYYGVH